jgi:hypothetical protein
MVNAEPEKTYTLAQAQAEMTRRECAARGHTPLVFNYDMTGWCECGEYKWTGQRAATTTEAVH